jgi:hypothetical protein
MKPADHADRVRTNRSLSDVRNDSKGACSVRRFFFARGEHRTDGYRAQRSPPGMAKTGGKLPSQNQIVIPAKAGTAIVMSRRFGEAG